jgi:hypothetical protein
MKLRMVATLSVALLGLAGTVRSEEQKQATPAAKAPAAAPAIAPARTNAAPVASSAVAAKPAEPEQYIVIGYLEKRDGTTITIKSGPHGAAYSAATKDGKVLFENLSSQQLQAKAPEIHDFLKSAVAIETGSKPVKKDATVRAEGRL